ncbi:MAG TPA: protein kinase [Caldimonas sp.]|nr:protein kinase [Caldimonas sp.]HEV7577828.1 protein kinase [Caldimonas sp.]
MTPLPELEAVRAAPPAMPGHTLAIGTRLREYEIKGLIGEGLCSIVYLAWDHALQRKVAVKEYMPASMVGRVQGSASVVVAAERHLGAVRAGLKSFVNEARQLGRFDHASLVKVYRFWEENGTAYMVMPYYEGPTLKAALAELGHVPSESELRTWLKPILNAVTLLHDGATWHQNIGPDEILLTPFGPVLLGFAAAAHAIEAVNHTPAAALKAGFAAIEQYGSEAATTRGPWTDLYALAATVYAAITGSDPEPAADRLANDRLRPLSVVAAGLYSPRFLAAIDAAMAVQPKQRPANHVQFRALMGDIEAPEAVSLAPRPDLMQEPFSPLPANERIVTVPDRPLLTLPEPAAPVPVPVPAAVAVPVAAPESRQTRATAQPATRRATGDNAAPAPPSWMKSTGARVLGKRALYGVVAGTCALIGIAALVLQFATRSAGRAPAATAGSTALHSTPAPLAATTTPSIATRPAATAAASAPTAATPRTSTAALPAPVTAVLPVSTTSTTARSASGAAAPLASRPPAPPTPASPRIAAAAPTPVAVLSPLERQTRCTDILQKASLEKITPAETDFFKRECK